MEMSRDTTRASKSPTDSSKLPQKILKNPPRLSKNKNTLLKNPLKPSLPEITKTPLENLLTSSNLFNKTNQLSESLKKPKTQLLLLSNPSKKETMSKLLNTLNPSSVKPITPSMLLSVWMKTLKSTTPTPSWNPFKPWAMPYNLKTPPPWVMKSWKICSINALLTLKPTIYSKLWKKSRLLSNPETMNKLLLS